jgi:hypothetical protein
MIRDALAHAAVVVLTRILGVDQIRVFGSFVFTARKEG